MFKRPSSRSNSHTENAELPLVPILDTMVTLIGFLLFSTSFLGIVAIESPLPHADPNQIKKQIEQKEKPLQLTLSFREQDIEIWSPFSKIQPKAIPNTKEGTPDSKAIHEALLEIKKKFPLEDTAILVPKRTSAYDEMIIVMDAARAIEPTDPPLYIKNETTGIDQPTQNLFPKIIFGNLLGDT